MQHLTPAALALTGLLLCPPPVSARAPDELDWHDDLDEALELADARRAPVLVYVFDSH